MVDTSIHSVIFKFQNPHHLDFIDFDVHHPIRSILFHNYDIIESWDASGRSRPCVLDNVQRSILCNIFNVKTLIVITLPPSTDTAILVSVIPAASNMPNNFLSRPSLSALIPNTDISSSPSLTVSETGSARTDPTSISSSSLLVTLSPLLLMLPSSASSGERHDRHPPYLWP